MRGTDPLEVTMFRSLLRSFASTAGPLTLAAMGPLLLCSGAKPAQAQSTDVGYMANIPFAFQMSDKMLPAGKYQITLMSPHGLRLMEVGGKHGAYVVVFPGEDARSERAQIRFTRYGAQNFLRDFSIPATGIDRHSVSRCSITRGEKQAAKDWVQTKQTFTTVALNVSPQH
jgi:hypothetical protein